MRKQGSSPRRVLLISLGIVLLVLLIFFVAQRIENQGANPEVRGDYRQRYNYEETITVNDVAYRKKRNLTSILLLGIDQDSTIEIQGYRNGGQADFLRLIVIDKDKKQIMQLPIDRDTMTPITILGVLGNQSGMRVAQICLSHGFGDGKEQSSLLTKEAVANLLLGTTIDYYLSMNLDGISVLNDWVDGVEVTLQDDFSMIDPTMTAGTTLTLVGDQAEIYVRSRMSIGVGTNEARMARQQDYISKLTEQLTTKFRISQSTISSLYDELGAYLVTDLSRGKLVNELWAAKEYEISTIEIRGQHQIGEDGFMQFIPEEDSIQDAVLALFYNVT